jgi:malate dehydrogenase (oxaloacetate-decarboxylating)(NADP+)
MTIELKNQKALDYHAHGKPGKLEIIPTKPMENQADLALAYSPGVAIPCLEIEKDPSLSYRYTNKGNMVAVISNGTAVLGLGNIGAQASKPVMEGKAVLFKKFAGVDSIDLEVDAQDPETFITVVRHLSPSFGGINLEDIKAPECFMIEDILKKEMNIPVFHDDQHGTAICVLAGLLNACEITHRHLSQIRVVINGAGAAAIACANLLTVSGVQKENLILVDRTGVLYKGRTEGMNVWKEQWAQETSHRTLAEAAKGADVLIGLSSKGAFTLDMIRSMSPNPIVFAMANPDPEISPEEVKEHFPDAIIATGRSDYPNQINNVLCFPFLFRGALDCRAKEINHAMKMAAAKAIANLAKEEVPASVLAAYKKEHLAFGREYILPVPLDPRLIYKVAPAVAKAAMETQVAQVSIKDLNQYQEALKNS